MKIRTIGLGVAAVLAVAVGAAALATTGYPRALAPRKDAAPATRIDNVRLVSMRPGAPAVQLGHSVLVEGDRITAIGPAPALPTPAGARSVDGGGQTLLPGLIDAHVHVWDEAELAGYLAHGVTSVRNMSGMPFHLPLAERIAEGRILGPDLLTSGPILHSPGPNEQANHQLVVTAEEARAAVLAQHADGYRTVKVYSNLTREAYEAILQTARELDMTVVGHTPEGVREPGMPAEKPFAIAFEEVLDDGFGTIEHVESIVWHGLRDRLDPEAMRALAQEIAAADVTVTPTLIAHANLVRVAESDGAYLDRPGAETVNPLIRRLEASTYDYWSHADPAAREEPRRAFYREATLMLHEAGVPLLAGSDSGIFTNIPGRALIEELQLLVRSGLTPQEALATATVVAGPALGLPDRGQIAPGMAANLVLAPGDPLADISTLAEPSGVMVRGVWLDEGDLADLRIAATQTSEARTGRRVASLLLRLR